MTEHGGKIGKTVQDSQPYWPETPKRPKGAPNILVILFDDVGFSDFGCYGSPIETPAIDALSKRGLRYTGFHTTAMCSTTRTALLTGRNHHSVGVGCLANFDSGYPGYRGKISREAGTIAEMLRPHGYRNYMLGKWHVTPLTESGATGPFERLAAGPRLRPLLRFHGCRDRPVRARTGAARQHAGRSAGHLRHRLSPDVRSRRPGDPLSRRPCRRQRRDAVAHLAGLRRLPCAHQAPFNLISKYDSVFAEGWDVERERRLARQIEMGIVPKGTQLPPRNDSVRAWAEVAEPERRISRGCRPPMPPCSTMPTSISAA